MQKGESIEETVLGIVRRSMRTPEGGVSLGTRLVEDLGADILDIIEFVFNLEDEFEFAIQERDIETLKTVGDVVKYIREKVRLYNGEEEGKKAEAEKA